MICGGNCRLGPDHFSVLTVGVDFELRRCCQCSPCHSTLKNVSRSSFSFLCSEMHLEVFVNRYSFLLYLCRELFRLMFDVSRSTDSLFLVFSLLLHCITQFAQFCHPWSIITYCQKKRISERMPSSILFLKMAGLNLLAKLAKKGSTRRRLVGSRNRSCGSSPRTAASSMQLRCLPSVWPKTENSQWYLADASDNMCDLCNDAPDSWVP